MELILYAIPFFFLLIFVELGYGYWRGRNTYRINDTVNSLSLGSLSRLQGLVILGFSGAIYEFVATRYQLSQLPAAAAWVWVSAFVLYDFAYYWKHRLGHEVALFWGSHVAHHQSEDFNLGTALRQTSIEFHGFLFYLPFFFLGYPAEVIFSVASLNLIYQFWVHTKHVPKLGILEWILVTPSNHRVHHGRNDQYVDKNYGGVFIVWDRLFGTYQEELDEVPVVFGLRKPLNSFNPLWANVHVYWRLLLDVFRARGISNKLQLLFRPPGWRPEGQRSQCRLRKAAKTDLQQRFDPQIPASARYYTLVQFVITMLLSLALLLSAEQTYPGKLLAVAYLAWAFLVHGLWLEGRGAALSLELIRLAGLAILAQVPLFYHPAFSPLVQLTALVSAGYCLLGSQRRAARPAAAEPGNGEHTPINPSGALR